MSVIFINRNYIQPAENDLKYIGLVEQANSFVECLITPFQGYLYSGFFYNTISLSGFADSIKLCLNPDGM